jgi:hypothetical protein
MQILKSIRMAVVATSLFVAPVYANLLSNGDFESGTVDGWALVGQNDSCNSIQAVDYGNVPDAFGGSASIPSLGGTYGGYVRPGGVNNVGLAQTLVGVPLGDLTYSVDFYVREVQLPGDTRTEQTVYLLLNGTIVDQLTVPAPGETPGTTGSFSGQYTATTSIVEFRVESERASCGFAWGQLIVDNAVLDCADSPGCALVPPPPTTYMVGGQVVGLSGSVTLQNQGADDLVLTADGAFTFSTAVPDGDNYAVTVAAQPPGQTCTVSNGAGTISGADVTDVTVTCVDDVVPTYSVGGAVTGLSGTVVLQNNGADDVSVSADGAFAFATELADGSSYAVTVLTQPAGQACTVSNGSGTISGADVTDVGVSCVDVAAPPLPVQPAVPVPVSSRPGLALLVLLMLGIAAVRLRVGSG